MLKQKWVGEYVSIKLGTGEELMTSIVDEFDDHFLVKRPHILYVQQTANGPEVGLVPFMQLIDPRDNVVIYKASVAGMAKLLDKAKDDYKTALGEATLIKPQSGLVMPS